LSISRLHDPIAGKRRDKKRRGEEERRRGEEEKRRGEEGKRR
jgi:hypothetical protein